MPQTSDPYASALQMLLELDQQQRRQEAQQLAAERASRDRRAAAFYAADSRRQPQNSDAAIASIFNNLLDNQTQLAQADAISDRTLQYQAAQQQYQMARDPINSELAIYEDLMGQELPADVQEGLASGQLRRTREAERRMEESQDAISKIHAANYLTDLEKASALRQAAEQFASAKRDVQQNPTPPVPLAVQFQQETYVDDEGVRWTRGRQGEWTPRPIKKDEPKDNTFNERRVALAENKQSQAERNVNNKARYDAAIERLGPSPDKTVSPTEYQDWLDQHEAITDHYFPPEIDDRAAVQGAIQSTGMPQQAPPNAQEAAQVAAYVQQGAMQPGQMARLSTGEYPIVRGDGDEQQYPEGTIVITTSGRPAIVRP